MRTEDGYIVHKCLSGDSAAFGLLVDKYKAGVYALAYSKLRDFRDAEDVAQEVFIRAYQKLRTLKQWDRVFAWLYSITSNLCRNVIRAQASRPDREYIADQDLAAIEEPSVDPYRDEPSMLEMIHEALDSLPEAYQQVITLYYLGGMNSREIATFLGMSPSAIRQRLTRARTRLKEDVLAMMASTFEEQRLQASFTFRVVESVKREKIHPLPRNMALPLGLSLAAGIVLTMLYLKPPVGLLNPTGAPEGSPLPVEKKVLKPGELPVDVLDASDISVISSKQGDLDGVTPGPPDQPKVLLLASRGVENALPQDSDISGTSENPQPLPDSPNPQQGSIGGGDRAVAFSPEGTLMALATTMGVYLYEIPTLAELGLLKTDWRMYSVAFSPDGRLLAAGGHEGIKLWDVTTHKEIATLAPKGYMGGINRETGKNGVILRAHMGTVNSVAFSPDGHLLASAGYDGFVNLWNVSNWQDTAAFDGYSEAVSSIAFSPDGRLLASGSWDNMVRLWGVEERREMATLKGHSDIVESVAFSSDGRLLASGSWDNMVKLWDIDDQKEMLPLEGHSNAVNCVAFSPDSSLLASGSWREVRLWDMENREEVARLEAHLDSVDSLAFSYDGNLLASWSLDSTVKLWDVTGLNGGY